MSPCRMPASLVHCPQIKLILIARSACPAPTRFFSLSFAFFPQNPLEGPIIPVEERQEGSLLLRHPAGRRTCAATARLFRSTPIASVPLSSMTSSTREKSACVRTRCLATVRTESPARRPAAAAGEEVELPRIFYTFRQNDETEFVAEARHRVDDHRVVRLIEHSVDELPGDLHLVEGKGPQVAER